MLSIKTLFGTEDERKQSLKRSIGFETHVCLPCIVQSYDTNKRTIEAQPAIRERYIPEDGKIQYVQYPLLINVPVVFPSAGGYHIHFPIKKGDECIVVFSDLSIDNFWLHGNVQNPVEQRRHDLSDGLAIFGLQNQDKIKQEKYKGSNSELCMYNSDTNTGISIGSYGITFTYYERDEETGQIVMKSQKFGI